MMRLSERRPGHDWTPGPASPGQRSPGTGLVPGGQGQDRGNRGACRPWGPAGSGHRSKAWGPQKQRAPHPSVAKVTRKPLIAQEDTWLRAPHWAFSIRPAKVFSFSLTWFPWFLVLLLCCSFKRKHVGLCHEDAKTSQPSMRKNDSKLMPRPRTCDDISQVQCDEQ